MGNEHGEWILYGVREDDPYRIRTPEDLTAYIDQVGFLPLFKNPVPGFSVEERTLAADWWTGDPRRDPWEWRKLLAGAGQVAYGKFFDKKAGFISLSWLPYFANWRREGYDFDARWEDGKAGFRAKRIMDLFLETDSLFSYEIKQRAGFGKGGEKNFEGVISELQMQTYLVIQDFRQRTNRAGAPYGWPIGLYAAPETLWGRDLVTSAYGEPPERSKERIFQRLRDLCPMASEEEIRKLFR